MFNAGEIKIIVLRSENVARPTKSVKALSDYSQTKAELKAREEAEEKLKGTGLPEPPLWLSDSQKEIFTKITECLKESEMLCINDVWLLQTASIAIDRLRVIEEKINNDPFMLCDKELQSARNGYTRDFYRACNELCLSPQSRAKLANTATAAIKKKPLEEIIEAVNEE